jgi:menaquinol-cytochrome c reductase iron-sulfur subunit
MLGPRPQARRPGRPAEVELECLRRSGVNAEESPSGTQPDTSRRRILKLASAVAWAICSLALGIPFVASLVGPSLKKRRLHWTAAGELAAFPVGEPMSTSFSVMETKAYIHEKVTHEVWVIRHPRGDVTVFSPICPHLGCRYDWDPRRKLFSCPCHGSVFSIQGKVEAGPAPRPLDTLPHKIDNGTLLVEWERFELGIAAKVPV